MQATTKQVNYLEILFNDLGFDRKSRIAFIHEEINNDSIKALDELNSAEASILINTLKQLKEEKQ